MFFGGNGRSIKQGVDVEIGWFTDFFYSVAS